MTDRKNISKADSIDIENVNVDFNYFDSFILSEELKSVNLNSSSIFKIGRTDNEKKILDKILEKLRKERVKEIHKLKFPIKFAIKEKLGSFDTDKVYYNLYNEFIKDLINSNIIIREVYLLCIKNMNSLKNFLKAMDGCKLKENLKVYLKCFRDDIKEELKFNSKLILYISAGRKDKFNHKNIKILTEEESQMDKITPSISISLEKGEKVNVSGAGTYMDSYSVSQKCVWMDEFAKDHVNLDKARYIIDKLIDVRNDSQQNLSQGYIAKGENNIRILFLDTGIKINHAAFKSGNRIWNHTSCCEMYDISQNKIIEMKTFVDKEDNVKCWNDKIGHGTHCASIAAGCPFLMELPDCLGGEKKGTEHFFKAYFRC